MPGSKFFVLDGTGPVRTCLVVEPPYRNHSIAVLHPDPVQDTPGYPIQSST